jgi:hypothetical protein
LRYRAFICVAHAENLLKSILSLVSQDSRLATVVNSIIMPNSLLPFDLKIVAISSMER